MDCKYDLAVIGSGPGGYVSAIRAAQLGLKPLVIEKGNVGGVCLNVGCIPSKSLIHQAGLFNRIPELEAMGIEINKQAFDYGKVQKKSRLAALRLSKGVEYLLKKNKAELIKGHAKLESPNSITVEGHEPITAKNIIIAAGSRPKTVPGFAIDELNIISSTGALMMQELPESILIIGSGAIGIEFAHIFHSFGVKIHLVEVLERILPVEDEEISMTLNKSFGK
ncbi:MAG: FAD-dependent oxidoreductase, partial [bacterium]